MLSAKPVFRLRLFSLSLCFALMAFALFGMYRSYAQGVMARQETQDVLEMMPVGSPVSIDGYTGAAGSDGQDGPGELSIGEVIALNREFFSEELAINEEFAGYLIFPERDDMVWRFVYPKDNDYYLTRNFNRVSTRYGAVFADARGYMFGLNQNNVLYAHNMRDGQMFGTLLRYRNNPGFYNENPFIVTKSLTGVDEWVIFSAYLCEPDYGYIISNFRSEEEHELILNEMVIRSMITTNIDVNTDDVLLTLSTCEYDFEDARFAVHARRLRPGETFENLNPQAELNSDPKPPQLDNVYGLDELLLPAPSFMMNTRNNKYYLHYASVWGIEWYTSFDTVQWQGPFLAYEANVNMSLVSWVSSAQSGSSFFLASNGLGGNTRGIFVARSTTPAGHFRLIRSQPVTPAGTDARYPLLAVNGSDVQLIYTDMDSGNLYMINTNGGQPHEIAADMQYITLRALDYFRAPGGTGYYLLWSREAWYLRPNGNVEMEMEYYFAYSENGIDGWQEPRQVTMDSDRSFIFKPFRSNHWRMIDIFPASPNAAANWIPHVVDEATQTVLSPLPLSQMRISGFNTDSLPPPQAAPPPEPAETTAPEPDVTPTPAPATTTPAPPSTPAPPTATSTPAPTPEITVPPEPEPPPDTELPPDDDIQNDGADE
jgi:sortase B